MERIYRTIKSVLDSSGLEDKDAPTNFSLIDTVKNMKDVEKHLWSQGVKAVYRTLIQ